ncbi:hypothetical protein N1851_020019 [Merluccius polli]|uniref:Uncharacterized protein n=1 Tax=Merluccius polli TaxID=89951 RepID=A0AA47MLI7_MERPO|nr:hypothetical protein N1851_020019 [Merluccius polli]
MCISDIPLAESHKNTADCSDLTEFVTLTPCEGEGPPSPILTDTLSISTSSTLSSDTKEEEYEETGSLKDSTRRLMMNIILAHTHEKEGVELKGGPTSSRTFGSIDEQQTGDECMEAMSLLHHTTDCDLVFQKMRETFHYRQQMLHDAQQSADILQMFPRFLDTKGTDFARLLVDVWSRDCFQVSGKMEHQF